MKIEYAFIIFLIVSTLLFSNYVDKFDYSSEIEKLLSGDEVETNSQDSSEFVEFSQISEKLRNFKYQIKTTNDSEYTQDINFLSSSKYNLVEGITTFRGNNYRDSASFGTVNVNENKLEKMWTNIVGQTDSWTGVGMVNLQ